MRKFWTTVGIVCALTTASLLPVAFFRAPSISAQAATTPEIMLTAKNDDFTVYSNQNVIYVYNRNNGDVWQTYEHTSPVGKLQITNDSLYFLAEQGIHQLDIANYESGITTANAIGLDCRTFFIENDTIFYTKSIGDQYTSIYQTSLENVEENSDALFTARSSLTSLYSLNDKLYFVYAQAFIYQLDLTNSSSSNISPSISTSNEIIEIIDMSITGDTLFTVTEELNSSQITFTSYDFSNSTLSNPIEHVGNFSGLSSHGGEVLLIKDGAPYAYEIATDAFAPAADEFTRPRVDEIPENGVKSAIESENASFSIVQTTENALFIEVDLDKSTGTFHYLRDERKQSLTALSLAVTDGYHLLFHRDDPKEGYKTYLVAANSVTPTAGESAYESSKTGYPTANATLYKFPSTKYPTAQLLARGEKLTVLGEVQGLDIAYYKVTDGERTGYIPQDFFVIDGGAREPQTVVKGEPTKGKDAIWRLAYILLGGVAICVLVDFLILRKKRED